MRDTTLSGSRSSQTPLRLARYRPEIDGLRAFAVSAVIANHFSKALLPSGYLGVDIFFVISGYVITSSLAGRESRSVSQFLAGFYRRRIKRLVPALLVFVALASVCICFFNPEPRIALRSGVAALFGLSNVYLFLQSAQYFAPSTELNPFVHTWSLGVEEQFYLVFPLLIWFSGFGRRSKSGARNLLICVGALALASLLLFIHLYPLNQTATYFLLPTRFWEMAAGCLVFAGLSQSVRFERIVAGVPPLLLVAALLVVMFLPLDFAVPATILTIALTCLLMVCLREDTFAFHLLTFRPVVYLGLISYSLYLWHWGVLSLSRWTIGVTAQTAPLQLLAMFALASLSYELIESPFRRASWPGSNAKTILFGVAAITSCGAAIGLVLTHVAGRLSLAKPPRGDGIYTERVAWSHSSCANSLSVSMLPSSAALDRCWLRSSANQSLPPAQSRRALFAYGDSYNEQLVPAYLALQRSEPGLAVHAYYSAGCPSLLGSSYSGEKFPGHCQRVFQTYLDYFWKNSRRGDILLLAHSPFAFAGHKQFLFRLAGRSVDDHTALIAYAGQLVGLADSLRSKKRSLVLVSGIPSLAAEPEVCLQWFTRLNQNCNKDKPFDPDASALAYSVGERLARAAVAGNFAYADIYSASISAFSRSPDPWDYYYNKNHLSRQGAVAVIGAIRSALHSVVATSQRGRTLAVQRDFQATAGRPSGGWSSDRASVTNTNSRPR